MSDQKERSVGWGFVNFGVFLIALGMSVWLLPPWCLVPLTVVGMIVGWFFGRWVADA